ncbi:FkbM family methyltransferase [Frigidibacter sp. MR17.24]|uniref:FkbM family methyltransferase n=1 Tax=Frigidibacter sp. MR17.24 TaxID=3127345 RepID=UPI003012D52A
MGWLKRMVGARTQRDAESKAETFVALCVATDGYDLIWDFCLQSQSDYCAKHGIEYRLVRGVSDQLNGKWIKLREAADLLKSGHTVLVVDADVQITRDTPHFSAAMLDEDRSIFIANGISGRANSGVMMLRGTRAIEFLETCLANKDKPVNPENFVTTDGENGHIIEALQLDSFVTERGILSNEWNCTLPEKASSAFFRHYTNRLRSALDEGLFETGNEVSIAPKSQSEAAEHAAWIAHKATRKDLLSRLEMDDVSYSIFKDNILAMSGKFTYPDMITDTINGWVWRYEFASGMLERPTSILFRRLSSPDSVFIDGGANAGYFSIIMSELLSSGRILAIEPHPDNFNVLCKNLPGETVTCAQVALSDEDGELDLFQGNGHSSSTIWEAAGMSQRRIPVSVTTIDKLAADHGLSRVDFLKLDIEGAEPNALRGAKSTLEGSENIVVIVESNPRLLAAGGSSVLELIKQMSQIGFVGRIVRDDLRLGPTGYAPSSATINIIFARPARWKTIVSLLGSGPIDLLSSS